MVKLLGERVMVAPSRWGWASEMQGENPLPLPPSQTDTDDPPCITGTVPPPGREVDVVDEADEIDVARITGRRPGLRGGGLGRQGFTERRDGGSMTSMASVTSPAQTGSKYVSGSAGSYHSLIQNCV